MSQRTHSRTIRKSQFRKKTLTKEKVLSDNIFQITELCQSLLNVEDTTSMFKENIKKIIALANEAETVAFFLSIKDDREDIEFLLDVQNLDWKVSINDRVKLYRARATLTDHKINESYYIPKYLTDCFSEKKDFIIIDIYLNEPLIRNKVDLIGLNFSYEDSADNFIKNTLDFVEYDGIVQDFALKTRYSNQYMIGDTLLWKFEYINTQIRHNRKVELEIVKRPHNDPDQLLQENMKKYKKLSNQEEQMKILKEEEFNYKELRDINWDQYEYFPIYEINSFYKVKICELSNIKHNIENYLDTSAIYIKTFLFYGTTIISKTIKQTKKMNICSFVRWNHWIGENNEESNVKYKNCPRGTRIAFLLYYTELNGNVDKLISWNICNFIDEYGQMITGIKSFKMWLATDLMQGSDNYSWIYRAITIDNYGDQSNEYLLILSVEFEIFHKPVIVPWSIDYKENIENKKEIISVIESRRLDKLCTKDILYNLDEEEKDLIWKYRNVMTKNFSHLSKFLQSVNWMNQVMIKEAYRLLDIWAPPSNPIFALQLLDIQYHDYKVRNYAVNILDKLEDSQIELYLVQLVQIIKLESYHDSPLSRFLLKRAIASPLIIGHSLFWHLKSEINKAYCTERFYCLLEDYLYNVGFHVKDLRKQSHLINNLQKIAEMVHSAKKINKLPEEEVLDEYKRNLNILNKNLFKDKDDGFFQMIYNSSIESEHLIIEKCKYMSSKKCPLSLTFKNRHSVGNNYIIVKTGDDLRQDILVLQLLNIMDKIWLSEGLDMKLLPYRVVATDSSSIDKCVGVIEVVTDSETTSKIQLTFGGGAVGAFKMTPLDDYLRKNNPEEDDYNQAKETFVASCAGYCVATFILGIGDRHNGNIMLAKDGHLFHIDFGHFLGNFKSKMGFKRERCPFVFTPEMAYVMGGKKYMKSPLFEEFKTKCNRAFNILRKHGAFLLNLFNLMIVAEMPELLSSADINYLRDMLHLDKNDTDAEAIFQKEIVNCLKSTSRQFDNLIHNWKHK